MNEIELVTLAEYANERENVVLFWVGTGMPGGDYTLVGHPDFDFADRRNLLDLCGTVNRQGEWHWCGEGWPADDRGNSIYTLHAYVDRAKWANLQREYNEAC